MAEGTTQKARMPGWLRVVLFGSLALNVAVIGLVAGVAVKGPPSHGRDRDPALPFTRAFDDDQRRDLQKAFRKAFDADKAKPDRAGLIAGYRTALDLLRADPFAPEAFRAHLGEQSTRAERRRIQGQEVLAQYVETMSAQERAAYADRLEAELDKIIERRMRWREGKPRP